MAVHFLDSSVFVRAYLPDEQGHEAAAAIVFGDEPVVASELIRVESARAVVAASRSGRLGSRLAERLLFQFESDFSANGVVSLIAFDGPPTLARGRELVVEYALRTLDALHLAVADREGRRLASRDEQLVFVTRDAGQRQVAQALGMAAG
ncbi:MAG TPA: type II toxin-antitoxin system VapC family toxin [Thermoleophilaceae bacterium]|nr:type II toxin-antitoxin system VapC family toxin [Thermoleophilaceae bacterium]